MPNRDEFRWFKDTFHAKIQPAIAGTPFTLDLLTAIAAQETGHIWGPLHDTLDLDTLLAICVGDTLDADKGRKAFPENQSRPDRRAARPGDVRHRPRGAGPDGGARAGVPGRCRSVRTSSATASASFSSTCSSSRPIPITSWTSGGSPSTCVSTSASTELRAAQKRAGLGGRTSLTDLEQVHVAIAYNAGSFVASKGLKQGHKNGEGKFYGELIFDFLRLAQTVPVGASPAPLPAPAPGTAPLAHADAGRRRRARCSRSMSGTRRCGCAASRRIDDDRPTSNVIAHLPDGHRVRLVTDVKKNGFHEVETSLNGAFFRGFAAAKFLVPVRGRRPRVGARRTCRWSFPRAAAPRTGVIEVHAPRRPGHVTKRTAAAGAHSLNEDRISPNAGDDAGGAAQRAGRRSSTISTSRRRRTRAISRATARRSATSTRTTTAISRACICRACGGRRTPSSASHAARPSSRSSEARSPSSARTRCSSG